MSASVVQTVAGTDGRIKWEGSRDGEGHREFWITQKVVALATDGPGIVMRASGLPLIGSIWSFGSDLEFWATCRPERTVRQLRADDGPGEYWTVRSRYSTKPLSRCQDEDVEDPLLEPQEVSGSFVKYTKVVDKDRNDDVLLTSSLELLPASATEFDANRPTVRIGQNVPSLGLATFAEMIDTVNDASLWGLGPRKIKLSDVSWERKIQGSCDYYYTRVFDFDIDFKTFDRTTPQEGSKVFDPDVAGADRNNPDHYKLHTDDKGNPTRILLAANGDALADGANPVDIDIEYYEESNFLTLGIPTTF